MVRLTHDAILLQSLIGAEETCTIESLAEQAFGAVTGLWLVRTQRAAGVLHEWGRIDLGPSLRRPTIIRSLDSRHYCWMQLSAAMVRFVLCCENHVQRTSRELNEPEEIEPQAPAFSRRVIRRGQR
jgi:hypothetical protein